MHIYFTAVSYGPIIIWLVCTSGHLAINNHDVSVRIFIFFPWQKMMIVWTQHSEPRWYRHTVCSTIQSQKTTFVVVASKPLGGSKSFWTISIILILEKKVYIYDYPIIIYVHTYHNIRIYNIQKYSTNILNILIHREREAKKKYSKNH